MSNTYPQDKFKTPDIALTVALSISGVSLTALEPIDTSKYLFVFQRTETLDTLTEQYYKGELIASIQDTLSALRRVKALIKYEQKR